MATTTTSKTSRSKTSSKTTRGTAKPATRAAATDTAPKAAPKEPVQGVTPVVVTDTPIESAGPEMKKQELLDKVVSRSDTRKKFAKPVVEAMLEILGETLAEGRELNLPPLGKVKLNRTKEGARARVIVAKIRQSKQGGNILPADVDAENGSGVKDEVADRAE
ncbi:DNA-binding protein HU-alpha [Roseovarius tolerans]|uniref:DNA-binding protein HU-alpha n=1 Tax=Roseovarius tolerans TaxID=74031 RepID=A0A1H8IWZ2_9RHOB|nr:HU family DNA-binding protein [Roseovarius tolerans]SEN72971.1 DNA-binding protein HU-alpha [Roseovarius tolerans]